MTNPREVENATIQLFRRALDAAPLMLWAIDGDGTYTMSEGKGLELLGMKAGESVGLSALEMFKDNPEITRALRRALAGEESRIVTSPAPGLHFENWYLPLRAENGSVQGAMGIAVDASERITREREAHRKLEVVERQTATMRALATPIIQVWDEVLCLPIIGTVDSARTAEMMQGLLESIVREQARFAIVDLTGVDIVDTSTADHLIVLFRAARVLGVEGVLCGIRPAVAQTIVGLGLDLGTVKTMRSLRDALKWCIRARAEQNADASSSATTSGKARG
jgi:rsbT co-antagonist protein RsbR